MEPTETGKFLTIVSLYNMLVGLGAAPAYSFIYQKTVRTHPAIAIYIGILLFIVAMIVAIYTHIDMKKKSKEIADTVENKEEEAATSSTYL